MWLLCCVLIFVFVTNQCTGFPEVFVVVMTSLKMINFWVAKCHLPNLFPLCDIFSLFFYIQLILREWTCMPMSLVTSETLWQIYIWYSIHPLQQSFTKDQNIFTEVLFLCLLVSVMAVFILGIQPLFSAQKLQNWYLWSAAVGLF